MHKTKNKVFSIASSLVVLSSCGAQKSANDPSNGRFGKTSIVGEKPIALDKQSSSCSSTESLGSPFQFSIPQFLDGEFKYTKIDFTNQLVGNYVKSPSKNPISKMVYGLDLEVIATYKFKKGEYEVQPGFEVNYNSEEKELEVCPDQLIYKPFTFESAGLNISNTITKTHAKVSSLGYSLDPVKVSVAPIRYMDLKFIGGKNPPNRPRGYEADNAYYSATDKEITFLPQSKLYQQHIDSTPFWQMPMVGSHEYGHHIFNTFVAEKISAKFSFSKNCFQEHEGVHESYKFKSKKRSADSVFALRSINEGFADLIAKYTLEEVESSMKAIKCFDKNRDSSSDVFANGDSKLFSQNVVDLIDSKDEVEPPKSCDDANYQEIHHVGAAFAHGANKIIGSFTNDKDVSLKILMAFAESLALRHSEIEDKKPSDYLFESLSLVLKKAHEITGANSSAYNCELLKEVFPAGDISVCEATSNKIDLEKGLVKP